MDFSGWPWVVIGIGLALTGLAIFFGMVRARRITPREKAAQQRAAHDNFRREAE